MARFGRRRDREEPARTPEQSDPPAVVGPRADGPWDASERVLEETEQRLDLGALSVGARPEVEVRLQVDEANQQVLAVMLVAADGAAEVRAFAAPRHEDLWDDVRTSIAAETSRRGGTATTVEGPYGPALALTVTGTDQSGTTVTQRSTVWGISGPRWLLRVTLFGRPATEYQQDGALESAIRDLVVDRGGDPMPPGEALPLRLPKGVQRPDQN